MIDASVAIAFLAGYGLGSVPFGLLLTRAVTRQDLRSTGSGNIGATNALRVGGTWLGIATLLLDFAKGACGLLLGLWLMAPEAASSWAGAALVAPVLGHCYPLWLRFRGGKGVATGLGVLIVGAPLVGVAALVAFLVPAVSTRYVSLGSIAAALAAAATAAWLAGSPSIALGVVAVALVVLVRHAENVKRLLRGEEVKLGQGR